MTSKCLFEIEKTKNLILVAFVVPIREADFRVDFFLLFILWRNDNESRTFAAILIVVQG